MEADGAIPGCPDAPESSPGGGSRTIPETRQTRMDAPSTYRHLVLIDGDCGLCQAAMDFVVRADPQRAFGFAPLASDLAVEVLRDRRKAHGGWGTMYVAADRGTPRERLLERSDAVLFVAGRLQWPWKLARVLRWLPRRLRDAFYDRLAANRHRFGAAAGTCRLPDRSGRDRIVWR